MIVCVGAIGLITYQYTESAFGSYVTARQAQALTARGRVLALTIAILHRREGGWGGTQALLQEEDANSGTRLLVVDNTGMIVADSSDLAIGQHFVRTANAIVAPIRRLALRKIGSLALIPLAENQAAQQAFLGSVNSDLLLVVVCALAAALALTYWNGRRVTRPLSTMTGAATRLAGGDLGQRVAVSTSGSEIAALAEAFNGMASSLEDAKRQRSALTADIAHELRTPLTSVRGYLEAIQDGAIAPSAAVIDSIHEEVAQLGALVGDLQDLALADAGQLGLQRHAQAIEPLLQQAVAMQEVTAQRRGISVRYQPPMGSLPLVAIDPLRLGQVSPTRLRTLRPGAVSRSARQATRPRLRSWSAIVGRALRLNTCRISLIASTGPIPRAAVPRAARVLASAWLAASCRRMAAPSACGAALARGPSSGSFFQCEVPRPCRCPLFGGWSRLVRAVACAVSIGQVVEGNGFL